MAKLTFVGVVKKVLAVGGILLFSLMLIALPRSMQQNPAPPGDYAYLIGQMTVVVLIVAGLFYSVRWYLKLNGHTYRLARQAWASILFVYALLATPIDAYIALIMKSAVLGVVMAVVWAALAFACWRWRKRLRSEEIAAAASKLAA